ncbi:DUF4184 family protein [Streptomyces sp. NPDC006552]|uniref:DUF4184 family protein n=1 Tax=Streptomyces sp. NPDC006552 TaxID=3157179 RepID=UPI00339FBDA6
MPFTISHAAAVLPFMRRDGSGRGRLVPSLLVAGSFAPDLTYFAAGAVPEAMEFGDVTHSFAGVCTVDVLFALALVGLVRVLRDPVLGLLPGRIRGRAAAPRPGSAGRGGRGRAVVWWYVSAVLGATTHVVWDAFTHPGRWGVRLFPVLDENVAGSPLYWYVQYGTSALALVVVAGFVWRARVSGGQEGGRGGSVRGPVAASAGRRWAAAVLIGGCVCGCVVLRVGRWLDAVHTAGLTWKPWEVIPALCFGAGAGFALGLVLYAGVYYAGMGRGRVQGPDRVAQPSRPSGR